MADWYQPTQGTSDFHHLCNWHFPLLQPHEGLGYVGFYAYDFTFLGDSTQYREYVRSCLDSTIRADSSYLLTLFVASYQVNSSAQVCSDTFTINYTDIDITIYGNASCNAPFLATWQCPSDFDTTWKIIGTIRYNPSHSWSELNIVINSSFDVNAIMIGGECNLNASYYVPDNAECFPYFYADGLLLTKVNDITCNDSNACTKDTCINEICQAIPICNCIANQDCDDNNGCTIDQCYQGQCRNQKGYSSLGSVSLSWWRQNCCCN